MGIYSIDPLDNQVSQKPSTIPTHPFQMVCTSPIGSGKSTLLINLFMKKAFFKGYFDRIVIFSPLPLELDPKWQTLLNTKHVLRKQPKTKKSEDMDLIRLHDDGYGKASRDPRRINPEDVHIEFDADTLIEILESQKDALLSGDYRLAVIFEDSMGLELFAGKCGKTMLKLATLLRHYQTSVIYCSQSYIYLPPKIRNNCTSMIVWNIGNIAERKKIYAEHPMNIGSFNKFNELFDVLMQSGPHPFIHFRFLNPIGKQIVLNFDRIVPT